MKKTVFVIGHTESTGNYIAHQLLTFLTDYINVCTWCTSRSPSPPIELELADICIVSNRTVWSAIHRFIPSEVPVLIADRVIGTEYLDKLLDLPPGTKSYVVGTTEETVQNTINILHSLGFVNFDYRLYYPGITEKIDEGIEVAITTGLSYLAPRHVKTIIDLGGKGLNLSSFAELLLLLRIPFKILNDISNYYLTKVVNDARRIKAMANQTEQLKSRLEVIINTVDEPILAVDKSENIVLFNQAAEKMLQVKNEQIINRKIGDVFPEMQLSEFLRTGKGVHHQLTDIKNHQYFLNASVFVNDAGQADGMVASLQPVQEIQELDTRIRRERKKKGDRAKYSFGDLKGSSPEMMKAISLAKRFAKTELTILLEGESGTGKELFAQSIHNFSNRRNGPFVAVNFAAIPDTLIESELFGYEEGAFTGAKRGGKPGLFEEAHRGTIFLDEIGSASAQVQNRLLRVLEERVVRRLGSGQVIPIDVRVIAATNVNLQTLVDENKFRLDLFYRLCTLPIHIPSLRERKSDILPLVNYFAENYSGIKLQIDEELANFLIDYPWPGNIRELQNVVQYLCTVVDPNRPAQLSDIPSYLLAKLPSSNTTPKANASFSLPKELELPQNQRLAGLILSEINYHSHLPSGIGWPLLLKKLEIIENISEYTVKKWLKCLHNWGYIERGRTKQGSRITSEGKRLLKYLQVN